MSLDNGRTRFDGVQVTPVWPPFLCVYAQCIITDDFERHLDDLRRVVLLQEPPDARPQLGDHQLAHPGGREVVRESLQLHRLSMVNSAQRERCSKRGVGG